MSVTLWEEKAKQFQDALGAAQGVPVFAVICGLLAKTFASNTLCPFLLVSQSKTSIKIFTLLTKISSTKIFILLPKIYLRHFNLNIHSTLARCDPFL